MKCAHMIEAGFRGLGINGFFFLGSIVRELGEGGGVSNPGLGERAGLPLDSKRLKECLILVILVMFLTFATWSTPVLL